MAAGDLSEDAGAPLSAGQLRLALDAARAGVWEWDVTADRVVWSDRLYDFHGIGRDAFGGRSADFVALVHPDDRAAVGEAIRGALESDREYEVTFRAVRPDGQVRWLSTAARLLRHGDGRPDRMVGITFDVTARQLAESELKQALAAAEEARREAEEAKRLRERLVAVIGHDLKTPLTAISISAARLERRLRGGDEASSIERVVSSARRMERMIAQLMDFAETSTAGGLHIRPEETDLHELCRRTADEVAVAFPGSTLTVDVEGEAGGRWDPDRLAELLTNLLGNAVQHGGGGPVTLRVRGAADGVTLEVHNPGDPIPPEVLPAIFEPFRRGDRNGDRKSRARHLGLGLYIAREIARAHGGRIDVRSPDAGGTRFIVALPRHTPVPAALPEP